MSNDRISASTEVNASAHDVFEFIRRPANHPEISGDRSVRGVRSGPEVLSMGDRFGMSMKIGLPYIIRNRVVEFEDDRKIAWCHPGRHRWRWEVEPLDDNRCKVTLTFDMSTALFPPALRLLGFPERHRANLEASVANVAKHFER